MKNADLSEKQQWQLLIDAIVDEGNAFSIGAVQWNDFGKETECPDDSFKGKRGTPACIAGWSEHLGLNIFIPDNNQRYRFDIEITMPTPDNSNAKFSYRENPKWFTRKKTVLMLKHFVATAKWDGDGKMIEDGYVDWRLDEREAA